MRTFELPRGKATLIIETGDEHSFNGTLEEIEQYEQKTHAELERAKETITLLSKGFADIGLAINSFAALNPSGANEAADKAVDTIQVIGGITTKCLTRVYSYAPKAEGKTS